MSRKWKLIKREGERCSLSRRHCEIIGSLDSRPGISGTRNFNVLAGMRSSRADKIVRIADWPPRVSY